MSEGWLSGERSYHVTELRDGNNLEDFDLCNFDLAGDLPNTDPLLGELADNGGPTQTHALLSGSLAIDAGNDAWAADTEQRGVPRLQGPASDIGAYEVEVDQDGG